MKKLLNKNYMRPLCVTLFMIYVCVLTYFVFLSDGFSRVQGYSTYRYNLTPFLEIKRFLASNLSFKYIFINVAGNVAAFMPFGALLRWVRNKKTGWFIATFYTFIFSLVIESVQLVTKVGVFDVDDLMLNTLGGLLGYICYAILRGIYNIFNKSNKKKTKKKSSSKKFKEVK